MRMSRVLPIVLISVLISVLIGGCLTTQEKADVTAADAAAASVKADVTSSPDDIAAADFAAKSAHAKADAIKRQRGIQIADTSIESIKMVLPFVPYGEAITPLLGLASYVVALIYGKKAVQTMSHSLPV